MPSLMTVGNIVAFTDFDNMVVLQKNVRVFGDPIYGLRAGHSETTNAEFPDPGRRRFLADPRSLEDAQARNAYGPHHSGWIDQVEIDVVMRAGGCLRPPERAVKTIPELALGRIDPAGAVAAGEVSG